MAEREPNLVSGGCNLHTGLQNELPATTMARVKITKFTKRDPRRELRKARALVAQLEFELGEARFQNNQQLMDTIQLLLDTKLLEIPLLEREFEREASRNRV